MCADFSNLAEEVRQLEKAGADRFHLDIMDGRYVPNFAMGIGDVRSICKIAEIPSEIHLMIEEPGRYIGLFAETGAEYIYFHPESDRHPATVIEKIRDAGAKAGIVLNPGTSLGAVEELLYIVDHVILMGVNPGHAGQIYLPYVDRKLNKLLALKQEFNLEISLDGACSEAMVRKWAPRGVDGFVLGTAALFGRGKKYKEIIDSLRMAANCSSHDSQPKSLNWREPCERT